MTTSSRILAKLQSESTTRIIGFVIGAIAVVLIMRQLQFSTDSICCGDYDGYYHVKWSRLLWESIKNKSFPPQFPWLPLTTLNAKDYVDHHLLFHILQMPFVAFRDPRLGAKIASVFFASLAMLSCYWLLIRYRVRYVLVWLIALLACSVPFLYRLNMAKAPPLAIIYLVIAVHLFFRRKYWPLVIVALLFTWTYDMFVLLIMATVLWVVTIAWTERRFEWRPLVWVLLGCAAGMVINPYFPHNFQLLYEHVKIKLTLTEYTTRVGQEWYPYDSWEFLGNSALSCIAMLVGYIAFDPVERKKAQHPLFFLLFSTALMLMTARWKRIAEYWPPFAILFAGFSLQPWLAGGRTYLTRLPPHVVDELKPFFDREDSWTKRVTSDTRELMRTIAVATVALALSIFLFFNLRAAMDDIERARPHGYYRSGAVWMRANIPPGQLVYNTNWDDFPRLFYFDETHYYVSGLDPTYILDKHPDLARLSDRINLGQESDPGPLIRDRFGARYVFTDHEHDDFFTHARESGWFDIVYEDAECTIMYIRDTRVDASENEPY
ncbi:MAG TPA: hypothetical protein VGW58_09075 [Pyrinomonadaceae bacterium]|nr:hypothetical protein [Pyrinomonadaceae bacterium]